MSIPYGPILIVEDTPNILELLETTLRFKGYPVVTAHNGQEAMEHINRQRPALVITDILMPKMDGYSLAHKLRTDPRTNQIPVIFISATYITPEDKAFALKLGAVRFIEKPIDTEDFLLTVAEILTQSAQSTPTPLDDRAFMVGYRQRLEAKLRHKNTQITRTERLLVTLPPEQRPTFEKLLEEAVETRDEIQKELNELYQTLEKSDPANQDGA